MQLYVHKNKHWNGKRIQFQLLWKNSLKNDIKLRVIIQCVQKL